jgi:hypothetical protein
VRKRAWCGGMFSCVHAVSASARDSMASRNNDHA